MSEGARNLPDAVILLTYMAIYNPVDTIEGRARIVREILTPLWGREWVDSVVKAWKCEERDPFIGDDRPAPNGDEFETQMLLLLSGGVQHE